MAEKDVTEKADIAAKIPTKTPLKKHLSSTFKPMIGQYMSDDQLAEHVNRQMTFFNKRYEPEEEPIAEEKKKPKKKVKFKKGSSQASEEETEREKERQEYREGLRDRVLEDLELLRDYYKRMYKRALNEKVANQHKEFKSRDAQAFAKAKKIKQKEEKDRHKVTIRLPKSNLMNDQTYKEQIEETVYHKIIKVEHQLKKQGYLAKTSEIKAFWDFVLVPNNLKNVMEKGKLTWEEVQLYEKSNRSHVESSQITDKKWNASDIDKLLAANTAAKSWHRSHHARSKLFSPSNLTDISSSHSGRRLTPLSPGNKTKSPTKTTAPNSAMALEQLFPKVEFPQLAAYTLVFGDQEPDPEEIERELEIERKETAKREKRSKLLTMFSHALANRAATQRLMDRNQNFSFSQLVGSTPVSELLYHEMEQKTKAVPLTTVALKAHDSTLKTSIEKSEEKDSICSSSSHNPEIVEDCSFISQQYQRLPPIDVPLSLGELKECPIKEAKGLSTLWVNPFSPTKKPLTVNSELAST